MCITVCVSVCVSLSVCAQGLVARSATALRVQSTAICPNPAYSIQISYRRIECRDNSRDEVVIEEIGNKNHEPNLGTED